MLDRNCGIVDRCEDSFRNRFTALIKQLTITSLRAGFVSIGSCIPLPHKIDCEGTNTLPVTYYTIPMSDKTYQPTLFPEDKVIPFPTFAEVIPIDPDIHATAELYANADPEFFRQYADPTAALSDLIQIAEELGKFATNKRMAKHSTEIVSSCWKAYMSYCEVFYMWGNEA